MEWHPEKIETRSLLLVHTHYDGPNSMGGLGRRRFPRYPRGAT